jgi:hypothetical protein
MVAVSVRLLATVLTSWVTGGRWRVAMAGALAALAGFAAYAVVALEGGRRTAVVAGIGVAAGLVLDAALRWPAGRRRPTSRPAADRTAADRTGAFRCPAGRGDCPVVARQTSCPLLAGQAPCPPAQRPRPRRPKRPGGHRLVSLIVALAITTTVAAAGVGQVREDVRDRLCRGADPARPGVASRLLLLPCPQPARAPEG